LLPRIAGRGDASRCHGHRLSGDRPVDK